MPVPLPSKAALHPAKPGLGAVDFWAASLGFTAVVLAALIYGLSADAAGAALVLLLSAIIIAAVLWAGSRFQADDEAP